ncbi:MAG: DUF1016 family protein [Flavobacteriales bacterium]|nr:DUF1016 family protein [Flavobacteriales bacterium]
MEFNNLVNSIQGINTSLREDAVRAVNMRLTVRNWLIGFYIFEFEQKGEERASYGENLIQNLANELDDSGLSARNLKLFRQFYLTYEYFGNFLVENTDYKMFIIGQTLSAQLQTVCMLLAADKNNTLVEYAIAGMDENIFVQKYLTQLPSKEEMENYLKRQLA